MRTRAILGTILAMALLPTTLRAAVSSYAVAKTVYYTQTSNAPPTTADIWYFSAWLSGDVPYEVLSATLSFDRPPLVTYDMYEAAPAYFLYGSPAYTSENDLDLNYPATTYTITIDRGHGPENAQVYLPAGLYCPEIPYFTGDTYDRLQNYNPGLPFDGTINGFTLAPGTNFGQTLVGLVEDGVGAVWSVTFDPAGTQFQIPAGLVQRGTNYTLGVSYMDLVEIQNAGFGTATSNAVFVRDTDAHFTTPPAPCRGDMNCDGKIDFTDIDPFVAVLSGGACCDPTGYNCDVNGDGVVDFSDIDPFVALLSSGATCP